MPTSLQNPQEIMLQTVDEERVVVSRLAYAAVNAGICADPVAAVGLYVSLKSKPLAILAGLENSGKMAMVRCLAGALVGGDYLQYQMMLGHPWWAGKSDNLTFFTAIHTRFISDKLLHLLEEASLPENAQRVFLACLTHISPAELLSFFTDVALQLNTGQLMRFGDIHLVSPIPFPPNMLMIGTMDTSHFDWWDGELLSKTSIIRWTASGGICCPFQDDAVAAGEGIFLHSLVRGQEEVYRKIHATLSRQKHPLWALMQLESLLKRHGVPFPAPEFEDVLSYLANAWSLQGNGLFAPSTSQNLNIALDLAISQIILPRISVSVQCLEKLRWRLTELLSGLFPRSAYYVSTLSAQGEL